MVTMRDVAAEAGVSPMTVSNALTGRRPVSDATRRRVLETVDRLGYTVNVAARSLRQGRTGVVGVAVPTLDSHYYGQLSHRLVRAFGAAGLATVVEETGASRSGELAAFRDSRRSACDGLVIAALGLSEQDFRALSGDVPIVVLGEQELHHAVDHVSMANVEGAAAATRLLIERGCRRLAVVGAPPLERLDEVELQEGQAFLLRARGFLDVARATEGVTATAAYHGATQEGGAACVEELLARGERPDGVFCVTDTLAFGALRSLADHRLGVPDDVLVVGFDDVADARWLVPSLSTVAPDLDELVRHTVRLLLRRIADPGAAPEDRTVSFRVVERETTQRIAGVPTARATGRRRRSSQPSG